MKKNILILGGAGFIGSNIVGQSLLNDFRVTVIDGVLPATGGDIANISPFLPDIEYIQAKIEDVEHLHEIAAASDVIVDSMAWTSHLAAIENPQYDLELNCRSHLHLIGSLKGLKDKDVIYLGSRGQYGNPAAGSIIEATAMVPEDIQGVHKLAAESYYRIYSRLQGFNVVSLRIPNVFGTNQPCMSGDIGLVGMFMKQALNDEAIEVFGEGRSRSLIYVKDLADIIIRLAQAGRNGFTAFNVKGYDVTIEQLATCIVSAVQSGKVVRKEIPEEIRKIDTGTAFFDDARLRAAVDFTVTDLGDALLQTAHYFKERLS